MTSENLEGGLTRGGFTTFLGGGGGESGTSEESESGGGEVHVVLLDGVQKRSGKVG